MPTQTRQVKTILPDDLVECIHTEHTSPPKPLLPIAIHTNFESRYEIQDLLGEGGMGSVYRALDKNTGRTAAIKFLKPQYAVNNLCLRYFFKEAKITAQLEHPAIIPVYDIGLTGGGQIYYVMREVHGSTLEDILLGIEQRDPLILERFPLALLLTCYRRILEAVAYAHAKGVIHLDLKPSNIMIGAYGEVVVCDWGIARLRRRAGDLRGLNLVNLEDILDIRPEEESQKILGTPAYMAPEQASAKSSEIGSRSDIYALGGILYHILMLHPPHDGRSTTEIIKTKFNGQVEDPWLIYSGTPPEERATRFPHLHNSEFTRELCAIATTCLQEKMENRYQSTMDLLRDYIRHGDPEANAVKLLETQSARLRQQRLIMLVMLIVLTALFTGLLILVYQHK